MAFHCHIVVVSSNLWLVLDLSLFSMSTLLKEAVQVFCGISLSFSSSHISSWWNWSYRFWGKRYYRRSAFSYHAIGKPMISTSLITGGHSLTMCLPGFSTRKSLFFLSVCDVLEAVSKSSSNLRGRGVKDHLLEGGRPRNLWAYVKNHLCN